VLSPEEIHRLAAKTRKAVAADTGKASCHSDYVDPEQAQTMQRERLVQLNTAPAHNLPSHDSVI
jgi:phosphomethylpyrimidine synthase